MKIAIAGAAGRMGRVLTRIVRETHGAEISGGLEPAGSAHIGADMGELAGLGTIGVTITDAEATVTRTPRMAIDLLATKLGAIDDHRVHCCRVQCRSESGDRSTLRSTP